MTEYVPDDHHDHAHDATPDVDLPDHHADDTLSEQHHPPLDDLPSAHTPVPEELHFPGDDAGGDVPVHDDLDPSAPWPDDDRFSEWLGGPEQPDDPSPDTELRDQLAAPADDTSALPSSDALVDWTLRQLDS